MAVSLLCILLKLFFLGTVSLSGTVGGQKLHEDLLTENELIVSWERSGPWFGATDYNVTVTENHNYTCIQHMFCNTTRCSFTTTFCGPLNSCSVVSLKVDARNHSESMERLTGPTSVSDVVVEWENSIEVQWHNPDTETDSPCYQNTTVTLTYNNTANATHTLPHDQETTVFPSCVCGDATLAIWTHSNVSDSQLQTHYLHYQNNYVVDPVTNLTCNEKGADGLMVCWDYDPVCPEVSMFKIQVDLMENVVLANLSTRSVTVTGLKHDHLYTVFIFPVDDEGRRFGCNITSITCETHKIVVQNLELTALSAVALNASWDPPLYVENQTSYIVILEAVDTSVIFDDTLTSNTSLVWNDLVPLTKFVVCVRVPDYSYERVCDVISTLPDRPPWITVKETGKGFLSVAWEYDCTVSNIQFKVMWGSNLEHFNFTEELWYDIPGYNNTEEVVDVCVAAIVKNMTSLDMCLGDAPPATTPTPTPSTGKPDSNMVWSIVLGIIAGIALLGVILAVLLIRIRQLPRGAALESDNPVPIPPKQ